MAHHTETPACRGALTIPDKIAGTEDGNVAGPAFVPPKWCKPAPLGYGNAIGSVTTVGSLLLAGFSLASVIVVTSEAGKFRWPGAAVLALTTAAVLLIASVQCTYIPTSASGGRSCRNTRSWRRGCARSKTRRSAGGSSGRNGRALEWPPGPACQSRGVCANDHSRHDHMTLRPD